jgi:translation initiation factor 2 alpha subunit (eIF-2alpha)
MELKEAIQQGVDSLTREQGEKDYRKTLAEDVKEALDIKPADFNAKVKVAYDTMKAMDDITKKKAIIDEVEAMGF